MSLRCRLRDERLSRFQDGELPLADYREVQDHLRQCGRCARRLGELQAVDAALSRWDSQPGREAPPARLALAVAVAAALLASLGVNQFLGAEPPAGRTPLGVPAPPSDTLSSLYARLAEPEAPR